MTGGVGGGDRLDSWKAIAAYLGKDAGTARRWERTRGLPVHRVPGGKGTSVYAYPAEIDSWLRAPGQETVDREPAEISSTRSARWMWIAALIAIVITSIGVTRWFNGRPRVDARNVQVHLTEQSVTAVDGDGRELWLHPLADGWRHIKSEVSGPSRVVPGDHSRVYYITSHRQKQNDEVVEGGEFTALDITGHEVFTFRFFDAPRFGGKPYLEPWAVTAFSVLDGDPAPRLAVAAHHWLWGPSLLAILDDKGNRLGTYANDGWIEQLHWLAPDRLVFGGYNESKNGGLVGLLDPRQLDGQTPEDAGSKYYCDTCGKNPPLKLAVMPRTEVNIHSRSRFNRAIIERAGDRLIVRTIEVPAAAGQGAADVIYEFTESLDLVSATFSKYYWQIHEQLYAEKKLDHDREHCPFRNGPPSIYLWTPDAGWTLMSAN
jgi:hypothetical protein